METNFFKSITALQVKGGWKIAITTESPDRLIVSVLFFDDSLIALGHAGFQITLYDADIVTTANQGRQLFADCEVGMHKATALINRINRFFGTNWKAVTLPYSTATQKQLPQKGRANITITCVDTVSARFDIAKILESLDGADTIQQRDKSLYWLDLGNGRTTGQAVLATIGNITQPQSELFEPVGRMPFVTEEFKTELMMDEDSNEPSCSLAEALEKQDLFINSTLANMASSLLWNLFREGMISDRGFFLNLKTFKCQPIAVG